MSTKTEAVAGTKSNTQPQVRVDKGAGVIWFIGWMFTIAFAELGWGKAILGLVLWPWYLGVALR